MAKKKKADVEAELPPSEDFEQEEQVESSEEELSEPLAQEIPEGGGSIRVEATHLRVTAHTYAARERGVDKAGQPRIFYQGKPVLIPLGELSSAELEFLKADHCLTIEHV